MKLKHQMNFIIQRLGHNNQIQGGTEIQQPTPHFTSPHAFTRQQSIELCRLWGCVICILELTIYQSSEVNQES